VWGLDWVAAPPPSSAVTVLAALQILEGGAQPEAEHCMFGRARSQRQPTSMLLLYDVHGAPHSCIAGFERPLASSGSVGVHRTVEALKHAFALRMSLGEGRWGFTAAVCLRGVAMRGACVWGVWGWCALTCARSRPLQFSVVSPTPVPFVLRSHTCLHQGTQAPTPSTRL
jgi:hypothetical protein